MIDEGLEMPMPEIPGGYRPTTREELVCAMLDAWNNWPIGSSFFGSIRPRNAYTEAAWERVLVAIEDCQGRTLTND